MVVGEVVVAVFGMLICFFLLDSICLLSIVLSSDPYVLFIFCFLSFVTLSSHSLFLSLFPSSLRFFFFCFFFLFVFFCLFVFVFVFFFLSLWLFFLYVLIDCQSVAFLSLQTENVCEGGGVGGRGDKGVGGSLREHLCSYVYMHVCKHSCVFVFRKVGSRQVGG